MKKHKFSIVFGVMLVQQALTMPAAFAADTMEVTVTIANGALMLSNASVSVTDTDADGKLTIHDALFCAHQLYFDGGAAAGYGSAQTDYGLSMTKLWGVENGGSYGYYRNNLAAMSLGDEISEGDVINAFVYTDLNAWSDQYCYFDVNACAAVQGDVLTLTLSGCGYDENYQPITFPIADASLTVNGVRTDVQTNAEGRAELLLTETGTLTISAVSDSSILVPPVCVAVVSQADTTVTTTETTTEATVLTTTSITTTSAQSTTTAAAPAASDRGVFGLLVASVAACGLFWFARKK